MSIEQIRRSYEIAPLMLVSGIAANVTNGQMTILTLTEGSESVNYSDPNDYFAHFKPSPGGTLVDYGVSEYPFASMAMAANAVVENALSVSLLMLCPIRTNRNNYQNLQSVLTRIRTMAKAHSDAGGLWTVGTPGYIYQNCILRNIRDVSSAGDKTVQNAWQWDFYQPLVTQQAAYQVFNNLYSKLAGGLPVSNPPTNSGVSTAIGNASTNQPAGQTVASPTTGSGPQQ